MKLNATKNLTGYQKKYLRGLAHKLKPVVMVGQKGATPALFKSVEAALMAHELIKIRFVESRDREQKSRIVTAGTMKAKRMGRRVKKGLISAWLNRKKVEKKNHPDKMRKMEITMYAIGERK